MPSDVDHTLCVVAVHFHNTEEVERFVEHVLGLPVPAGWRVVISLADNSRDWSAPVSSSQLLVSGPDENLGYLNGCAHALDSWVRLDGTFPAWTAVVNTDIDLADDVVFRLLQRTWPQSVGVVAPHVTTSDGLHQNPFLVRRPPAWRLRALLGLYENALSSTILELSRSIRRPLYAALQQRKARRFSAVAKGRGDPDLVHAPFEKIYAAHGSAFFLSKRFLELGGRLETPIHMFGEEIHIAEQAHRVGLDVVWVPSMNVEHRLASTTGQVSRRVLTRWKAEALRQLLDMYYHPL